MRGNKKDKFGIETNRNQLTKNICFRFGFLSLTYKWTRIKDFKEQRVICNRGSKLVLEARKYFHIKFWDRYYRHNRWRQNSILRLRICNWWLFPFGVTSITVNSLFEFEIKKRTIIGDGGKFLNRFLVLLLFCSFFLHPFIHFRSFLSPPKTISQFFSS